MAGYVGNCQKLHNGTQSCDGVASCEEKNDTECKDCAGKLCVQQAQRFKANVTGDRVHQMNQSQYNDTNDVELLLVNGQHKPTLDITAGTWVRLRLGFMATGKIL